MKIVAAILAAGQGTRFGADKTQLPLGGKPVWRWSFDVLAAHPRIDRVVLVCSEGNVEALRQAGEAVLGGSTRQESSRHALEAARHADVLLVHDAARPFLTADLIDRVLDAVHEHGAAAAACSVTDTIKCIEGNEVRTLDRSNLVAMQTPQAAKTELLRKAHEAATEDLTDEMALIEAIGVHPRIVPGEPNNFKITSAEDYARARGLVELPEVRTGIGYDIHSFSDDPNRPLYLGGVHFVGHPALEGHSDADVLLHAVTDALLGAAALGDIGEHFPNTDPRWHNEPSLTFLRHAGGLLREAGWQVSNIDITVIAETPKVMKRAEEIREKIAGALDLQPERVAVKATTNERLGAIGRGEGIAAFAIATIRR
jgi:2-C-methyl-D-erythritol 4-phosphate cytidylyltransferase / 2-C-methyl-D-erythritol 2,4-cyclodiphosphate synthase